VLTKLLATIFTLKRLLSGVGSDVSSETRLLSEPFITNLAHPGQVESVGSLVHFEYILQQATTVL